MKENNELQSGEILQYGAPPKRNNIIDVLKGLAIICMVAAHCGFPYTEYIYLFHMAVFMMASGYFFSSKNAMTIKSVVKYIYKKVLALYIPYVLFNGMLVLLHNTLIELKVYTYDPQFLEIGGFGAAWGLIWPYTPEYKKAVLMAVLKFQSEPQLAGANWFLRALFYVSVGHCVIMWAIQKIKPNTLRNMALVLLLYCTGAVPVPENGIQTVP